MNKRNAILLLSCMMFFIGCDLAKKDYHRKSELPADIVGYKLIIYNTEILENPDNLYVSSRTEYYFIDSETIAGQGDDDLAPIDTETWSYSSSIDEEFGHGNAEIVLNYGSNIGKETYILNWDAEKKDLEERQNFSYVGEIVGTAAVWTTGYYEIEKY